jgi:geranylgeranyl pyrophosphate synthase
MNLMNYLILNRRVVRRMSALEKMIGKGLEQASKVAFKAGGEAVRQAFASEAGRALKNGNGGVMKVFNAVGRALKKM